MDKIIQTHEDNRRKLIEWVSDYPIRACKVVVAKKDCVVGEHYHKEKDEIFYLLNGNGEVILDGKAEKLNEGDVVFVSRNIKHSFALDNNSILLGACSKPFDPNDDYT